MGKTTKVTNQRGCRRTGLHGQYLALLGGYFREIILLFMLALLFAPTSRAVTTVTLTTPTPVVPASMCPGTNQQVIYEFTLVATGLPPNTTLTSISFNQSGTALGSDVIMYKLWSGSPGGTLVASSTTTAFTGLSTLFSPILGTTINYWITADIAPTAVAGRTIVVDPMTTANFVTSSGFRATFGTIAAGGAQSVLLSPANITGSSAVCVASTVTLSNSIAGGSWSSSNTALATIDPATGIATGVSDGSLIISYQLPTGCFTTAPMTVNPLPPLNTVTGGGSYCFGGTGVHVGLDGSATGINYELLISSSITPTDPMGTGSAIDFGLQTAPGIYTVLATNMSTNCSRVMAGATTVSINLLPVQYNVTGGGAYCFGGSGYHIGLSGSQPGVNYRLLRGESTVIPALAGTGSALDFGTFTGAGNYTVVATDATTGCTNNMSGSADIILNTLPLTYAVSGGGAYCAGGEGVHVGLSLSQSGVIYVLYNGSSTVGSPLTGTGSPLDFGAQTAAGTYTVVAIDATTYCSANMAGSATVVINPLPTVYSVTGGGAYCAGGSGVHVGLTSSDAGITYMLYNGTTIMGSPLAGTGSALDFGLQTPAGPYTVMGVNSTTTCTKVMSGAPIITINPLPTVYSVTGGGNFCDGSTGVHVGLESSAAGIEYQLYYGSVATGYPLAGTGAAIDFGPQTAPGIYTVTAVNSTTACTNAMEGSATVAVNPLPLIHNVTGGGHYCTTSGSTSSISPGDAGTTAIHVGLDGSDAGMIYLLYNGTTPIGSPVAGTGAAIDFGVLYNSGTYSVEAIDATTLCTQMMSGSAVITIVPIVIPAVSIATFGMEDTACQGSTVSFNALGVGGGPAPIYQWSVNGSLMTSTINVFSYIPGDGDAVTVTMISNAVCAQPLSATTTSTVNVIPAIIPAVDISVFPDITVTRGEPVVFTANITDGGATHTYQWYVNSTAVAGAVGATFTTSTLANNDSVSCMVTRHDACGLSGFNSVRMTIINVGVSEINGNGSSITAMPNPSNGTFTVTGTVGATDADVTMEVVNITGQVVYQKKVTATGGKLNEQVMLNYAPAGMYILNVRTASSSKTLQLVVQ